MTKNKAKSLVSELIELGFAPTIREESGNYKVSVSTNGDGVSPTGVTNLANQIGGITAKVFVVEFN